MEEIETECSLSVPLCSEAYKQILQTLDKKWTDFIGARVPGAKEAKKFYQTTTLFESTQNRLNEDSNDVETGTTRYRVEMNDPIDSLRYTNFEYPAYTTIDQKCLLRRSTVVCALPADTDGYTIPQEIVFTKSRERIIWNSEHPESLVSFAERAIISKMNEFDGSGRCHSKTNRLCVRFTLDGNKTVRISCGKRNVYRGVESARCSGLDEYRLDVEIELRDYIGNEDEKLIRNLGLGCLETAHALFGYSGLSVIDNAVAMKPTQLDLEDKFILAVGTYTRNIRSCPPRPDSAPAWTGPFFVAPKWDGVKGVAFWNDTFMFVVTARQCLARENFSRSPFIRPAIVQLEIHRDDQELLSANSRYVVTEILALWGSSNDNLINAFRDFVIAPGEGNYNNSISSVRFEYKVRPYFTRLTATDSIWLINAANKSPKNVVFTRHCRCASLPTALLASLNTFDGIAECIRIATSLPFAADRQPLLPTDGALLISANPEAEVYFKIKTAHTIELELRPVESPSTTDESSWNWTFISADGTEYKPLVDESLRNAVNALCERQRVCTINPYKCCLDTKLALTNIFEFSVSAVSAEASEIELRLCRERPDKLEPDKDRKIADIFATAKHVYAGGAGN